MVPNLYFGVRHIKLQKKWWHTYVETIEKDFKTASFNELLPKSPHPQLATSSIYSRGGQTFLFKGHI